MEELLNEKTEKHFVAIVHKASIVSSFNARSRELALVQLENGRILEIKNLTVPLFMNKEQGFLDWLSSLNICAVVTTVASPEMLFGLKKRNMAALKSSPETVNEAVEKFIRGELNLLGGCNGCSR